jgi:hypothetical protein
MIRPGVRDKRSRKWKRCERSRPMELRQIDIVGGFPIADATSAKVDDYSTKRRPRRRWRRSRVISLKG